MNKKRNFDDSDDSNYSNEISVKKTKKHEREIKKQNKRNINDLNDLMDNMSFKKVKRNISTKDIKQKLDEYKITFDKFLNISSNRIDGIKKPEIKARAEFKRELDTFFNDNEEEIFKFLSLITNGNDNYNLSNVFELRPADIIYGYFYFGICPGLLPKPDQQGFQPAYFMWVKETDPRYDSRYDNIRGHSYSDDYEEKPFYNTKDNYCNPKNVSFKYVQEIAKMIGLPNASKVNLCKDISEYFQKMSEKGDIKKCVTKNTLTGTPIGNIPPLFFTMYKQNDVFHCGDLRDLSLMEKNPDTGILFTQEQKDTFTEKINIIKRFYNFINDDDDRIKRNDIFLKNILSEILMYFTNTNNHDKIIKRFSNMSRNNYRNLLDELSKYGILTENDYHSLYIHFNNLPLAYVLEDKLKNALDINYINGIGISTVSETLEKIFTMIFVE